MRVVLNHRANSTCSSSDNSPKSSVTCRELRLQTNRQTDRQTNRRQSITSLVTVTVVTPHNNITHAFVFLRVRKKHVHLLPVDIQANHKRRCGLDWVKVGTCGPPYALNVPGLIDTIISYCSLMPTINNFINRLNLILFNLN